MRLYMKIYFYVLIGIAFILITFFGVGPVLMADGSTNERLITLLVVIILYVLLWWVFVKVRKRK
jgi:Na+-driven multidrug efflux pump